MKRLTLIIVVLYSLFGNIVPTMGQTPTSTMTPVPTPTIYLKYLNIPVNHPTTDNLTSWARDVTQKLRAVKYYGPRRIPDCDSPAAKLLFDQDELQFECGVDSGGVAANCDVTGFDVGSVVFVDTGPVCQEDNPNLFWDDTNNELGINKSPDRALDVTDTIIGTSGADTVVQIVADVAPASSGTLSPAAIIASSNTSNANNGSILYGAVLGAVLDEAATWASVVGVSANTQQSTGTSTISSVVDMNTTLSGDAVGGDVYGSKTLWAAKNTSEITNLYGQYVAMYENTTSGAVVSTYGFYCADISSGNQTNGPWCMYNSDGDADNYNAGSTEILKGLIVGFDGTPVEDRIQIGDANFYLDHAAGQKILQWESGDYIDYASDELGVYIGGAEQVSFTSTNLELVVVDLDLQGNFIWDSTVGAAQVGDDLSVLEELIIGFVVPLTEVHLHVWGAEAGTDPTWDTGIDLSLIESATDAAYVTFTGATDSGFYNFADPGDRDAAGLEFDHNVDTMYLNIGGVAEFSQTATSTLIPTNHAEVQTGGLCVGFDCTPTADVLKVGDANFSMYYLAASPLLTFDTFDWIAYTRADDEFSLGIAAVNEFTVDPTVTYTLSNDFGVGLATPAYKLQLLDSVTHTSGTDYLINATNTWAPSGAGTGTSILGTYSNALNNSNNQTKLGGLETSVTNAGGADLSFFQGWEVVLTQTGGTNTNTIALEVDVVSAGSTTDLGAVTVHDIAVNISDATDSASSVILFDTGFLNSGTVDNDVVAFYANDLTSGTITGDSYSFYGSDSGAYSYFAGSVGIGTDDTPDAELEIESASPAIFLSDSTASEDYWTVTVDADNLVFASETVAALLTIEGDTGRWLVQNNAAAALELLSFDQNDVGYAFIDYIGTSAGSAVGPISTWTTGNAPKGHFMIEINGTPRWVRFYDAPTS